VWFSWVTEHTRSAQLGGMNGVESVSESVPTSLPKLGISEAEERPKSVSGVPQSGTFLRLSGEHYPTPEGTPNRCSGVR
jgi:hypothetical protein